MAITSSDIQNQSFKIERRGYDVDDADKGARSRFSLVCAFRLKRQPLLLALRLSLSARLLRLTKRQSLQASILLWLPRKMR